MWIQCGQCIDVCRRICGPAPVVMVGEEIHGNVTPDQVPILLKAYLKQARGKAVTG